MTVVGTAPLQVGTAASAFDVSKPDDRARLLARLRPRMAQFSDDDMHAYNALRDVLLQVARGEAGPEDASSHLAALASYFENAHEAAPVPQVVSEARSEVSIAPEVKGVEVQAAPTAPQARPVSTAMPVRAVRRGPDLSATVSIPEVIDAPIPHIRVTPDGGSVVLQPAHELVSLDDSVPEVPKMPEVVPEVSEAPEETTLSSDVEMSPESAPVAEVTPAAVSPLPENTPAEEVDAPSTAADAPVSAGALQEEVEHINDELNNFAHGTAFKWLSDPKTGYRDYLNALLELRGVLASPEALAHEAETLAGRVQELRAMAETVRRNVGGDTALSDANIERPLRVETVVPSTQSVAPTQESTPTPAMPSVESAAVTISAAPEPLNIEPQRVYGAVFGPTVGQMGVVPDEVRDDHVEAVPVPESSSVAEVVQDAPAPTEPSEPEAAPLSQEAPLLAPNEPESALMEKVPVPDSPLLDPLHSKAIDTGLNDLLTRWLGSTGFLGLGASGVKHPDWLKMKDVLVDDALHGDGFLPEGLRQEIFDNLGQNIRAWRDAYALYPTDGEMVEHYVRRVVEASLPK